MGVLERDRQQITGTDHQQLPTILQPNYKEHVGGGTPPQNQNQNQNQNYKEDSIYPSRDTQEEIRQD